MPRILAFSGRWALAYWIAAYSGLNLSIYSSGPPADVVERMNAIEKPFDIDCIWYDHIADHYCLYVQAKKSWRKWIGRRSRNKTLL